MKIWKYIVFLLLCLLGLIIIALIELPDGNLHIIACDVGQGDAILTVYKNIQILTDGGPDSKVLGCLGRHLPFWDRTIELVISTHPDSDHSRGISDVIKRYKVAKILVSPIDPGTEVYRLLENMVGSRGVGVINPKDGMGLGLNLIHLDILSPNAEMLSRLTSGSDGSLMGKYQIGDDTNLYSIVYRLSFKRFGALFMGDVPPEVADRLSIESEMESVNYIKIPHHGSVNGMTENLLKAVEPKFAVISVGTKNPWGLPSPKILQMLADYHVKVLRTDRLGDVEVVTDGERLWTK